MSHAVMVFRRSLDEDCRMAMDLQVTDPRKTEVVEGGRKAHGDSSPRVQ